MIRDTFTGTRMGTGHATGQGRPLAPPMRFVMGDPMGDSPRDSVPADRSARFVTSPSLDRVAPIGRPCSREAGRPIMATLL